MRFKTIRRLTPAVPDARFIEVISSHETVLLTLHTIGRRELAEVRLSLHGMRSPVRVAPEL